MVRIFKFLGKSFFAGCFAVLGAGIALLLLAVCVWLLPGQSFIDQYLEGPAAQPTATPAPQPTPTGELPTVTIWMTLGQDAGGAPVTMLAGRQLPDAHVWVSASPPGVVPLQLWLDGPMGYHPWGPEMATGSGPGPTPAGFFATTMSPGKYTLTARIGETVVGQLVFVVTE